LEVFAKFEFELCLLLLPVNIDQTNQGEEKAGNFLENEPATLKD